MTKISKLLQTEPVLCAAAFFAAITCLFVPPSGQYLRYIDFRVLSLLFCLMLVVAALSSTGFFSFLAGAVVSRTKTVRGLVQVLVLLCFFSSMLITNDVALITFVPFAIAALSFAGRKEAAVYTVVLQTVAANLGSMLTPLGNPQNLYLYSYFKMQTPEFFSVTLPLSVASFLLLMLLTLPIKGCPVVITKSGDAICPKNGLCMYTLLFLLCVLTVLHLIPYPMATVMICAVILLKDRSLFAQVDYALLLTFIAFFIFVGNLSRIESVRLWISSLIDGHALAVSLVLSQVISNVPAAVMLSGFTGDAAALVAGVNIGGLGTLIASLASLISFKLYCRSEGAEPRKYLAVFSSVNFLLLAILYLFSKFIV